MKNRTLDTWKIDPVVFELKERVKTIYSRPYSVPKVPKDMFKNRFNIELY